MPMAMPTMRPADSTTTHKGRAAAGAGGATFSMGFESSAARGADTTLQRSGRSTIISHGSHEPPSSLAGGQHAPLQLDDAAGRMLQAAADELDRPRRPGDAVEVVAGE